MEEEVDKEKGNPRSTNNNAKDDNNKKLQSRGNRKIKATSCKGFVYYSSTLKSNARNPFCLGITRSLTRVPRYEVGEHETILQAKILRKKSLPEFKYICLGYSVHLNGEDPLVDVQQTKPELPLCVGIQALLSERVDAPDSSPAHVGNKEDSHEIPMPLPRSARSKGLDFMSKFPRNASVVAGGVAKNLNWVGKKIKGSIDDILYPDRNRPK